MLWLLLPVGGLFVLLVVLLVLEFLGLLGLGTFASLAFRGTNCSRRRFRLGSRWFKC